jgi:hypothetical protein
VYLGETLRRVHGGSWEKAPSNPEGLPPMIRHRKYQLLAIETCSRFLAGKPVEIGKGKVTTLQQYYQAVRPMLEDIMMQRLLGTAANFASLQTALGPDREFNQQVLDFAESCVLLTYGEHGIALDFSADSLRSVDEILQKIRALPEEQKKNVTNYDPVNLIYWYGCYAGEVFRRVLGGIWTNAPTGDPPQSIPRLEIEGMQVFVLNKAKKALQNGESDSIAFMLHGTKRILEEQRAKAAAT